MLHCQLLSKLVLKKNIFILKIGAGARAGTTETFVTAPAPPENVCLQPIKLGSGHLRRRFFATAWTPYNLPTDVSSPRTADRGPSQVEGSKGIVATNWGPTSGPADQWGTGTKDAYLMPPPPTPHTVET